MIGPYQPLQLWPGIVELTPDSRRRNSRGLMGARAQVFVHFRWRKSEAEPL